MIEVETITVQVYRGVRYYKCGMYFQNKGKRLHRKVWEDAHGPISKGLHVHHKDGDRSNNTLENLELLTPKEHNGGKHGKSNGDRAMSHLPKAREAAKEWHKSEAGKQWHAKHFENSIRPVLTERVPAKCQSCGEIYQASKVRYTSGQSRYCGGTCKARARRERMRAEQ